MQRSLTDRRCAALSAVCFAAIVVCILAPAPDRMMRDWSSSTIYPWWSLALAVAGAGLTLAAAVLPPAGRFGTTSAAMAGVFAAELGGLGLVARKHWPPAFGMGGGYSGDLPDLQRLALLAFAAGAAAAVASLIRLVVAGALPQESPPPTRWGAVAVGVTVLVLLPVGIGLGSRDDLDTTSLAAYALIYSAPWGLSLALTGWLSPAAARAVMAACAFCALLALLGPQMADLVHPEPRLAFALALAAVAVAAVARVGATSRSA